ncbi:ornithine decarboxylase, putative [Bodo saltans]|uniref:Ornithine decarboxylase, putative n=1 Tax=Bodo saltans TaxID=75058 RepID=A0A0S4JR52_BODSA|nr:ornithine decarboxylase, putative [Bodo saltans]|eukprot:CUG91551.1 ornithine decarboxylase, putative [Bodo saltans]
MPLHRCHVTLDGRRLIGACCGLLPSNYSASVLCATRHTSSHASVTPASTAPPNQSHRYHKRRKFLVNASQQRIELGEDVERTSNSQRKDVKVHYRVPWLSRCLLTPLAIPGVGQTVQSVLANTAGLRFLYTAPVTVYRRSSCAPPLLSSSSSLPSRDSERVGPGGDDATNTRSAAAVAQASSSSTATSSLGILSECLPCVYIGRSAIHDRGVFTRTFLKKGTRIITVPEISFMDGVQFLFGCSDTHSRLPGTLHYTLPTGRFREFIQGAHAHHFMNHSCASNVCTGLSRQWWWPLHPNSTTGGGSGMVDVMEERMRTFDHFDDPNSFFAARDIEAGEELTLDYYGRFGYVTHPPTTTLSSGGDGVGGVRDDDTAPSPQQSHTSGAWRWLSSMMRSAASQESYETGGNGPLRDCRCGQPQCRGDIFPLSPVMAPQQTSRDVYASALFQNSATQDRVPIDVDEAMLVSMLRPPNTLASFIAENLHASSSDHRRWEISGATTTTSGDTLNRCRWRCQTSSKTSLLLSYRHVFQELNLLEPEE